MQFGKSFALVSGILLLALSACPSLAVPPGKHLPLPASASIQVGKKTLGDSVSDAEMCKAYSVTPREIRSYFRTYVTIDAHQKHYLYQRADCFIEGTVLVKGRTFTWIANPGGTLNTTYPDGIEKDLGTTDPAMLDTP